MELLVDFVSDTQQSLLIGAVTHDHAYDLAQGADHEKGATWSPGRPRSLFQLVVNGFEKGNDLQVILVRALTISADLQ